MRSNATRVIQDLLQKNDAYLYARKYSEFDEILANLDVTQLEVMVILAYARGTYTSRKKLKQWAPFVERGKRELDARGLDGQRLMRGLE